MTTSTSLDPLSRAIVAAVGGGASTLAPALRTARKGAGA